VTKRHVFHQKEIMNSVEYEPGFGRFGVVKMAFLTQ
jgi:hypothetical protein